MCYNNLCTFYDSDMCLLKVKYVCPYLETHLHALLLDEANFIYFNVPIDTG